MTILKRLGFYLIGFSIGLLFLAYFLKGKNTEFCYTPNCRVLKNIRTKNIAFAPQALQFLYRNSMDSLKIKAIFKEGEVIFSKSLPQHKPCAIYTIRGSINKKPVELLVENCDSVAVLQKLTIIK